MSVEPQDDDSLKLGSRENSTGKDLSQSRSSIKSTKSIEKAINSSTGSLRADKDVHFGKESVKSISPDHSATVSHKIIANWRNACSKTKDRTKDLLKRWRTLPEYEDAEGHKKKIGALEKDETHRNGSGWSVHVWTTWVDRLTGDATDFEDDDEVFQPKLTATQSNKFLYFFNTLLDHDQDNLISEEDFEAFIERLRHFADWSINSQEYNTLREVEQGFIETFLQDLGDDKFGFTVNDHNYITQDGWLYKWGCLILGCRNLSDFPVWLQYFVKILFQIINKSGNGIISRDELKSFYSSVLGFESTKVDATFDVAYRMLTSNGDHPLTYRVYQLCFANYLLARYPNGPGQYIFGAIPTLITSALFPIDYSALNTQPEDLEQYIPDQKSNRRSIIV
ncbi:uncharacterized protein [Onthophagus taurus]|uniref:uncharacterized protein n=1 Tax=Onthophagus taurus TaxID=166361 RepID=UPI000C200CAF|nr:uncharacterized protein LOC111414240 [Onthophagus taurus]